MTCVAGNSPGNFPFLLPTGFHMLSPKTSRKLSGQRPAISRSALRFEFLESRNLMAATFLPEKYFDRQDIGGGAAIPIVGDFNGDGRDDIGVYVPNGNKDARWVVKFNQGNGNFAAGTRYDIDRRDIGGVGETPIVGDFNGDGRDDIGVYVPKAKDARWVVKFNQGNGSFASGTRFNIDRRDFGGVGETPIIGDFNGDGHDDIGVYVPNGSTNARWVVKFNQGKGRFADGARYNVDRRDIGGVGETPLVGDFNADGVDDIGVYVPNGNIDARWVVKFNRGSGRFTEGPHYGIDRRDMGGVGEKPFVGDFDRDGRADVGVYVPNGNRDARWVAKLGDDGFDIDMVQPGNITPEQRRAFQRAADRWEAVIVADRPDDGSIDDLEITFEIGAIDAAGDEEGNTLAHARWTELGPDGLPSEGEMRIDEHDAAGMTIERLADIIAHEIGHILGLESNLWSKLDLLTGEESDDPRFTGNNATREYNNLYGVNELGVPVENSGGPGTRDSHWRDSVFGSELMTGWADSEMQISPITIGALADMGYGVDWSAAEHFEPTFSTPGDDFGNVRSNAEVVNAWLPIIGTIEQAGDRDVFRFQVQAGQTYAFTANLVTLFDTVLKLYRPDGRTLISMSDDSASSLASQVDWTADFTGEVCIEISGFGAHTGSYSLFIRRTL
jgi:flagellar hook assembly protein FlgD/predicted Zn-dependent protease with MMP-like domain